MCSDCARYALGWPEEVHTRLGRVEAEFRLDLWQPTRSWQRCRTSVTMMMIDVVVVQPELAGQPATANLAGNRWSEFPLTRKQHPHP